MSDKQSALFSAVSAILLVLLPCFASAQTAPASNSDTAASANARTVITILPKKDGELLPTVNTANVAVKVDNKQATAASLAHFGSGSANLELVLLVDDSGAQQPGALPERDEHISDVTAADCRGCGWRISTTARPGSSVPLRRTMQLPRRRFG